MTREASASVDEAASFQIVLDGHAARTPDRIALVNPGGAPWTYADLAAAVNAMVAVLRVNGVRPDERVALIARNSAEYLACYLAITAANVVVPLNPSYREAEFDFAFEDLHVSAVVSVDAPDAELVAKRRGLSVIPVSAASPHAGAEPVVAATDRAASTAIVLHTSGTTSRPKIVPLTNANVFAASEQIRATLALTADDRCLNVMPAFHIHGLSAFLATLLAGGSVVCPPEFVAPEFFDLVREFQPTWYTAAPTIHQSVLEWAMKQPEQPPAPSFRFVRSASSSMPQPLIRDMEQALQVPFIEAYGMTEAAPIVSTNPLPPGERKLGSVGRPAGCEVGIMLDRQLLPIGETGEIVVRGPNIMGGYENDQRINDEQFVDGWFRTGDLGTLDDDGYLFVTGRLKEIINRGGEKIAPAEVDQALRSHPAVAQAVTFPVPHPKLGEEVAALVVLKEGHVASERELQEHVAATLADFKVPRHIEFRDSVPKESTGKLKRDTMAGRLGLTELFGTPELSALQEFSLPRTPDEEIIAGIWEEVLRVERIGIHDDFFALGGDSVLAAQALVRLNDALGTDFSFLDFFENRTIAQLSELSLEARPDSLKPPPVVPAPDGVSLPLSVGQHASWFMNLLNPKDASYNVYRAIRMRGPLDLAALEASLAELVQRHDSLRTTYEAVDGAPALKIAPYLRVEVPLTDLSDVPEDEREARAIALLEAEAAVPFDLAKGPVFRPHVVRLSESDHMLLLTMHHIMMDGWSSGILFSELEVLYGAYAQGRKSPLAPPALRYADYAYWQRQRLTGEVLDKLNAYWKQKLTGSPASLRLPFDHERPKLLKYTGDRIHFHAAGDLGARLKGVAREQNATLFMGVLAAFKALLLQYSGQTDIVVGSPISGRDRPELEPLIGFFSNTLVMRTQLDGDPSFEEVIRRVRTTVLEAHAHHELPFSSVVAAVGNPRVMNQNPLFQVNFRLRNIPQVEPAMAGLAVEPVDIHNGRAKFELAFELWESPEGLTGFTEFSTELFERATVDAMVARFIALLRLLVASPGSPLSTVFSQLEDH